MPGLLAWPVHSLGVEKGVLLPLKYLADLVAVCRVPKGLKGRCRGALVPEVKKAVADPIKLHRRWEEWGRKSGQH